MTAAAKSYATYLGPYELVDVIEVEGGLTRYLAREERPGEPARSVELECLSAKFGDDSPEAKALCRRARFGELLSHPTVRAVLAHGRIGGRVMAVREHCSGVRLSDVLDQATAWGNHPRSSKWVAASVALVSEIAIAIEAIHDARLDAGLGLVSPEDVLLSDAGRVRYLGIERIGADGVRGIGQNDTAFVAPERRRGDRFDRRADVWSLGACLWTLLVGEIPNRRSIPAPSSKQPAVPARLDAIVRKALAENPVDRTPSPKALATELESLRGAFETEHQRTFSGCDLRALVDHEGPRDSGMSLLAALESDATSNVDEIEASLIEDSGERDAVQSDSTAWEFFDKTGMAQVDHAAVARKGPKSISELAATFASDLAEGRKLASSRSVPPPAAHVRQTPPWPPLEDEEEQATTIRPMPDEEELFPSLESLGIAPADRTGRTPLYSDVRELAPKQPAIEDDAEITTYLGKPGLRQSVTGVLDDLRYSDAPWLPWAAAAVAILAIAQGFLWWSFASGQESRAGTELVATGNYAKPARAMKMGSSDPVRGGVLAATPRAADVRSPALPPAAELPVEFRDRFDPTGGADIGNTDRNAADNLADSEPTESARTAPTPPRAIARTAPARVPAPSAMRAASPWRAAPRRAAPRRAAPRRAAPRRAAAAIPAPEEDEDVGVWRDVTSDSQTDAPSAARPTENEEPRAEAEAPSRSETAAWEEPVREPEPEEPPPPVAEEADEDEDDVGVWRDVTR